VKGFTCAIIKQINKSEFERENIMKKYLGILEERRIIWIFEDFTFQIIINLNFCLIERKLKFRGYFQEMEEIY